MENNFNNKIEEDIINSYLNDIPNIHLLAKKFKVGHKKISKILKENNITLNKIGGQKKIILNEQFEVKKDNDYDSENYKLMARCKKTNTLIDDPNNLSGILTKHVIEHYGNIDIPTNTYQRKKYELINGKKWFEEYFDIIQIEKKKTRTCKLCDWETIDIENKTGCFENHLKNIHNYPLVDYIKEFPEEIKYHKHIGKKDRLSNVKKNYEKTLLHYESKFTTKPQLEIYELIKSFGVDVKLNDKKLLKGIEIDILIDEFKLGIEYNGLYYHTESNGKDNRFHLNKTKLMNECGYKLIHIFEDEWIKNKEMVKNKITHLIGRNSNEIIGARKCEIIEISKEDKNIFLEKNHIQGKDKSVICLGAIYKDELVAVMTFDGKRNMTKSNSDNNIYELTRFATDIRFKIPGIADKLLKQFIKLYNPTKIISFGDIRWVLDPNNNMYTKLGFKIVKVLSPDYKYYNPKINRYKRLHKFGFGKTNLKKRYPNLDYSKTEKELTKSLGFDRIWDCGLIKFELEIF
jgi:very-short-patch-repair endonuclease/ribosomal protein S18 acetylase RimI-like enzyme